jgi:hypothetical protein
LNVLALAINFLPNGYGVPANRNSCHVAIIWYAPVLSKHGSGIIFFVFCFLIFNPKKDDEKIYFPAIVPAVG